MSHHYSGPDFGFPHGDARLDLTDLYAFPKPGDIGRSILIMNVHPCLGLNPAGSTTDEPFATEAVYELKIDTDGDAVADIAYRVRFTSDNRGGQTATLRRVEGKQAAVTEDDWQTIIEGATVSTAREAHVTEGGEYRFFAGWRSDPFFFDTLGALNNLQFTGADYFTDKDVCSIVLEVPNSAPPALRRWACGRVRWTVRAGVGSKRTAARGQIRLPSLLASRTPPISLQSQRTMPVSSRYSRTRWSTRADIRRQKQLGSPEPSCRTSSTMIPRGQHPTRTMAGHSPTTS